MITPVSRNPNKIVITYRNVSELKTNPRNPRIHSKNQIRQLAASISAFGFNIPIVVDGEGQLIAGHGRLLACQHLGWTDIPTICLDHLTATQAQAFMIADNRLAEIAVWDDQLLAEQLKELSLLDLDFNLDVIGFDMGEIDFRIEGLAGLQDDAAKLDEADSVPPLSTIAVTQIGDVWQLGKHRLHCGNALDPASYSRLMDDKLARMVFSDQPYNVPIGGHVGGKGDIQHREFAMASGEMSQVEFTQFLTTSCELMARHSEPGAIHYLCMDWRHMSEMLAAGGAVYSELKNLCVWTKDTGCMGSLYRSQHELVFVFKHGTAPHINNVQLGKFGRNRTNVWKYPGVNSFGRTNEEGNQLAWHPTVKPVAMVADALLDCSNRGDIVLDSFLGSGTTLMAAERVGRICCGMELEPGYVDISVRRWQTMTGQCAIHRASGQTFSEREQQAKAIGMQAGAPCQDMVAEVCHDN